MSKATCKRESENLEKSRKKLKLCETGNFTKDLGNQDEVLNLVLKSKESQPSRLQVFCKQ